MTIRQIRVLKATISPPLLVVFMRPQLAVKTLRLRFMTLLKPPRATMVQVSIHAILAPLDGEPYAKMLGHPV